MTFFRPNNDELVRVGFGLLSLIPAISVLWDRLSGAANTDSPSKNGDKTVPVSAALTLMCFSRALPNACNAYTVEHICSK